MTIIGKVISSVIAPLMIFFIMLPISLADDKTKNVQVVTANSLSADSYLNTRKQSVSRSSQRVALTDKVIKNGKKYLGVHYCHGGTTPSCFDCSGFTEFVYAKSGISIPRDADSQLSNMKRIPKKNARPGDLVFFISNGGHAYHVGIYIGNDWILHSPKPGRSVKYEKIWTSHVLFATIK